MFFPNFVVNVFDERVIVGRKNVIEWLRNSLSNELEDREDGDVETVPLIPLTEECAEAMEEPDMEELLLSIGLKPPADEQVNQQPVLSFTKIRAEIYKIFICSINLCVSNMHI